MSANRIEYGNVIPSINCCKDCKDRQLGCHGKCERYINQKDEYLKRKKEYMDKKVKYDKLRSCDFLGGGGYWRI